MEENKNIFHYNFSLYMNNKCGNVTENSEFRDFFSLIFIDFMSKD